jgi:hypothetical protein
MTDIPEEFARSQEVEKISKALFDVTAALLGRTNLAASQRLRSATARIAPVLIRQAAVVSPAKG